MKRYNFSGSLLSLSRTGTFASAEVIDSRGVTYLLLVNEETASRLATALDSAAGTGFAPRLLVRGAIRDVSAPRIRRQADNVKVGAIFRERGLRMTDELDRINHPCYPRRARERDAFDIAMMLAPHGMGIYRTTRGAIKICDDTAPAWQMREPISVSVVSRRGARPERIPLPFVGMSRMPSAASEDWRAQTGERSTDTAPSW